MKRILLLGANGQVGTEVCLLLGLIPGVQPIAACRSELGSAFLRRHGVECRHGSVTNPKEAEALLDGADVVADFSLISGAYSEMRRTIAQMVSLATKHAARGSRYVYISSEMAYGQVHTEPLKLKWHTLSRTVYGASKRFGENLAMSSGREAYVLRLGQVHGELQSESRRILKELETAARLGWTAVVPEGKSDSVFAFSIAEALAQIAEGKVKPDTYTLISEPQWTWEEVFRYYLATSGLEIPVEVWPMSRYAPPGAAAWRTWAGKGMAVAAEYRELLSAYILYRKPELERKMASDFRRRRAVGDIANLPERAEYRPCHVNLGDVPGTKMRTLSDTRVCLREWRDRMLERMREHETSKPRLERQPGVR